MITQTSMEGLGWQRPAGPGGAGLCLGPGKGTARILPLCVLPQNTEAVAGRGEKRLTQPLPQPVVHV